MNSEKYPSGTENKKSIVMIMHYISLAWRSLLFVVLLVLWVGGLVDRKESILFHFEKHPVILTILWLLFAAEMLFRFFPSAIRSPGCQKQFARNYMKTGRTDIIIDDNHATVLVAIVWITLNGIFGALHMLGLLDVDFMLLLCSAFSVCDLICILFFCPFQTWFFKNRCCVTCRIYNWDFAMMFTPLFFVPHLYTWSLLLMALALLLRWEITFFRHPERFSKNTNGYISCANCTEKLCRHKKQLASLWKQVDSFTKDRIRRLGD